MPLYDYKCEECGNIQEELKSFNDTSDVICEKCNGISKRIISGSVGIVFKGTGFYKTDYK